MTPGREASPSRRWAASLIVLAVFLLADSMQEILRTLSFYGDLYDRYSFAVPESLRSLLQIALVLGALTAIYRGRVGRALEESGLARPLGAPLLFGLLATLPFWLGATLTMTWAESIPPLETFYLAFLSPLAEELIYRGFAFGQLRRLAGWGFWPAALVTSALFGWGHLHGTEALGQVIGVLALTGVGSLFLAWIYERWGFNLWAPLSLHVLLNLGWQLFEVGDSAFAGWFPTVLQVSVMVTALALTLLRRGVPGRGGSSPGAAAR